MRLAAAILVITCHTSPLAGVSVVGDLLTRIVARVAIPFYFMATGLFTISRYHRDNRRLKGFMKKIGTIYAASVLLYLPLNIYQDYFNRPNLLPNLLRGLVFDGTVYHLWHLPAAMPMACRGVYPTGARMCESENLQLPLLGASVWTSLRWILPMHLGLLSEILLRWSITGKTAGFLPLVLQSKQEASAISC